MIGLDTTAIIDFYKGEKNLKDLIDTINEPLATNQIVYLELMYGIDPDNKEHKIEEDYYDILIESLFNFDLDAKACKKTAEIAWKLKKEGKIAEQLDCSIAAIYLINGINKIITKNTKHFENIRELKVISY